MAGQVGQQAKLRAEQVLAYSFAAVQLCCFYIAVQETGCILWNLGALEAQMCSVSRAREWTGRINFGSTGLHTDSGSTLHGVSSTLPED